MKKLGPEKVVEKEVIAQCKMIGIDVDVIDSKAIFSQARNSYTKNYCVPEGAPDLWGNDNATGIAFYLELKAPGKKSTLRPAQRKFLERKIDAGCFAACVDSAQGFFDLYLNWKKYGQAALKSALDEI